MGKRNPTRSLNSEVNNSRDPEAITRQSEDPKLDANAYGNDTTADVNQLNAFGGDQPARTETSLESHGEDLDLSDERDNESVEAVVGGDSK